MRAESRIAGWVLAGAAILAISACAGDWGYYSQCVQGHLGVLARRQPIDKLLADPATTPELKEKLSLVLRIRDFASRQLHLPDNGSYRCYADLQRPEVVWNVVATPEFSLSPRQWCFPVAGCVSYRGYYARDDAEALAEKLRLQGDDVHLYGVEAYSTLGWFDDPVLNTFVDRSESRIAGLVFHELSHQNLYVKDDTAFNEAFAEAVAQEGVARWLRREGREDALQEWLEAGRREEAFVALLQEARLRLERLYATGARPEEMRAAKAGVFADLRRAYVRLKERWGGYAGYDSWFSAALNNARLASVSNYRSHLPAFAALLSNEGGDLPAFYRSAAALGQLPPQERRSRMQALAPAGAGPGADVAGLWEAPPEG